MKTLLIVSALVISAVSFGGPQKSISCAVMSGNKVDIAKATKSHSYADYKGNRYFFCCGGCPAEFKKDPAKFAKAPHIKTPKIK